MTDPREMSRLDLVEEVLRLRAQNERMRAQLAAIKRMASQPSNEGDNHG